LPLIVPRWRRSSTGSAATTKPRRCSAQALAVFVAEFGAEHYEVAVTLHNLAAIAYRRGDLAGAEATAMRSLELRAAAVGPDHPELASTLNNLAVIHRAQGRLADAAEDYRRALDLLSGTVDDRHPTLVALRAGRADVHLESQRASAGRRSR
jgi:Tfp pilus assembly protein PilF